ncbi:HAD family hydrolase [Bifidobacterium indicum]|uniref:HAD family hydrolase n=2 Tax=Bifidobacterium indicum TaxID=1691 RepID=UPI00261DAC46|nr:HAD family hydrolase [uncultured Bifidobacterium sp.]
MWTMELRVDGYDGYDDDGGRGSVRHLIFGLRGTLVDWDPRAALAGQYPDGVIDMVLDPEDEWGIWRFRTLMNLGWDQKRVLADYESTHGPAVAWVFRLYLEGFARTVKGMQPGMAGLLADLHDRGLHLWGLANTTAEHARQASELLEPLGLLEDTLISAEEHLRMPDGLVYRLALRRFGIPAGRTIFVGDSWDDVAAAETCGIRGLLFTGAAQLRTDLRGFGLPC